MVRSKQSLEEEYLRLTPKSRAQWERGRPVMPGGVIKGAYWKSPHPIYVDRADGCYLWDLDGRRYVDFSNHHSTTILGHNHPAVIEALQRELDRGLAFGAPTTLDAEIAEELVKRFPSIDKVRYMNSATEASIHTTRLVRAVTGKQKIAKFEGAYHGSLDALEISVFPPLDKAGPEESPTPVAAWQGMARGCEDDIVILPYGQRESVELLLREHRNELAAVFYDGKPAMLDVPLEFTRFLRDITRELGLYMVMDEVVSFRVGYGGYQGLCGVTPDLTIFGKIVGGGLPVGALGGRTELMDVLDNTGSPTGLSQSGTFSGNSLTLAAGLATLRALTPEVYEHLDSLRERLQLGLADAYERVGVVSQIVGVGSMVNTYFTDRPVTDYRAAASADKDLFDRVHMGLVLKGYMAWGGMGLIVSEPMGTEHIDGLLHALKEVLEEQD